MLRARVSLPDDTIRHVAPPIFAHTRKPLRKLYLHSEHRRLRGLQNESLQPFVVCQTRGREDRKRDYMKQIYPLRRAERIIGGKANEIVFFELARRREQI